MMFGPTLPMLLLAIPVLVSVIVVLAGLFSLFIRTPQPQPQPQPQPLPRAIAMPVAAAPTPRPTPTRFAATVRKPARAIPIVVPRAPSYSEEEQTIVFARAAR